VTGVYGLLLLSRIRFLLLHQAVVDYYCCSKDIFIIIVVVYFFSSDPFYFWLRCLKFSIKCLATQKPFLCACYIKQFACQPDKNLANNINLSFFCCALK